jgi:hypothetical protein
LIVVLEYSSGKRSPREGGKRKKEQAFGAKTILSSCVSLHRPVFPFLGAAVLSLYG